MKIKTILTGGALVLAAAARVFAQPQPFMDAGTAQPPLLPPAPTPPAEFLRPHQRRAHRAGQRCQRRTGQ